jgi:hypothetical protein
VGIARGFLLAGAAATIVSLWSGRREHISADGTNVPTTHGWSHDGASPAASHAASAPWSRRVFARLVVGAITRLPQKRNSQKPSQERRRRPSAGEKLKKNLLLGGGGGKKSFVFGGEGGGGGGRRRRRETRGGGGGGGGGGRRSGVLLAQQDFLVLISSSKGDAIDSDDHAHQSQAPTLPLHGVDDRGVEVYFDTNRTEQIVH